MPLVFSHELDPDTIQAGDFLITDTEGMVSEPLCSNFTSHPENLRSHNIFLRLVACDYSDAEACSQPGRAAHSAALGRVRDGEVRERLR